MREARFVGVTTDGRSLIVEHDGEHVRLPLDERVRDALSGDVQMQMPMPVTAPVTPREIQHRIRCGESVEDISAKSGMALERVARFEGPVVAERRHVAERAQKVTVDGVPLGERVTALAERGRDGPVDVSWDAWLSDDGEWRVVATFSDGRTACWRWNMQAQRLRPVDDVARAVYGGGRDELEAVLRPVAWEHSPRDADEDMATHVRKLADKLSGGKPTRDAGAGAPVPDVPEPAPAAAEAASAESAEPPPEPKAAPDVAREPKAAPDPVETRAPAARKRRPQVPTWDEIVGGRRRDE